MLLELISPFLARPLEVVDEQLSSLLVLVVIEQSWLGLKQVDSLRVIDLALWKLVAFSWGDLSPSKMGVMAG